MNLGRPSAAGPANGLRAVFFNAPVPSGWTTKIHLVAADARTALTFARSPGQAHDAPEGRKLLQHVGRMPRPIHLLMDRAYEGDATRELAVEFG